MSLEIWVAFALASAAVLAIPGPTVMLVVSYALGRGRATGWWTVPGVAMGDLVAMTVSLAGAGALLAASATLFAILKYVGAAYLIWLGVSLWRASPNWEPTADAPAAAEAQTSPPRRGESSGEGGPAMFWNAFVVTALNPKSIVFFVAFAPQFIDAGRAYLPQVVALEATFVLLAALNAALWAGAAGALRARFRRPGALRAANRVGGGFLIGAGVMTATVSR